MRITEIVASRCTPDFNAKCTGGLTALPDPLAAFKGITSSGRKRESAEKVRLTWEGRGWEVLGSSDFPTQVGVL